MSRLLFIVAIVVVVFLLLKSMRKGPPQQQGGKPVAEDMVRCAQCGVHLPRSESIMTGGNYFCCVEHRDAWRK